MSERDAMDAAGILSEDWMARSLTEFLAASELAAGDPPGRTSGFLDRMMLDRRIVAMLSAMPDCLPEAVAASAARRALDPVHVDSRIDAVFGDSGWPGGRPPASGLASFSGHALAWVTAEGNTALAMGLFAAALANLAAHAWRTPDGNQLPADWMCAEVGRNVMLPDGTAKLGSIDLHHLGVGYMIPLVHGFGDVDTAREHLHLLTAYASRTNAMRLSESQLRLYEPRLKAMAVVAIYAEAVALLPLMRAADHVAGRVASTARRPATDRVIPVGLLEDDEE